MVRARSAILSQGQGVALGSYRLCQLGDQAVVQVKSLYVRNGGTSSQGFDLYARSIPGGGLVGLHVGQIDVGQSLRVDYWIVLEDLDELVADIGGSGLVWWISGSILEGTVDTTVVPLRVQTLPAS